LTADAAIIADGAYQAKQRASRPEGRLAELLSYS
jgi:hypothetical protein